MNGQSTLKKYGGLALIVTALSLGAYKARELEPINYIVYTMPAVIGAYGIGNYNGFKRGWKRCEYRSDHGLRYKKGDEQ